MDQFLHKRPNENLARLSFYGGNNPTFRLLSKRPELTGFSKKSVKKCATGYVLIGWTGYVPESCRNTIVGVPKDYTPFIWGWPRLFVSRMEQANTSVILVDQSDGHMDGIDDPLEIQELSKDYRGIVWTDKIEVVGSYNDQN